MRLRFWIVVAAVIVIIFAATKSLSGQINPYFYRGRPYGYSYSPGYRYAYPYYRGYYPRGTTAAESYMRGRAAMMRAMADYNLRMSQAAIHRQEAYRKYLENRKKAVTTYFEMREKNRQYRAEERKPAPTPDAIARYAKVAVPDRPSADEFNRATGEIYWPAVLQSHEYGYYRVELDTLFASRTSGYSGQGSENCERVQLVVEKMRSMLKANIDYMSPQDYVDAKRFLNELAYEAKFEVGPSRVSEGSDV